MNRLPVNWRGGKQKESRKTEPWIGGQDGQDRREEKVMLFSKFQNKESRKKKEKTERRSCYLLHDRQDFCWGEIASRDTVKNCRRNGGRRE